MGGSDSMKKVSIWILTFVLTLLLSILIIDYSLEEVTSGLFQNTWKSIVSLNPFQSPNREEDSSMEVKIKGFLEKILSDEEELDEEEDREDYEDQDDLDETISNFIEKNKEKISEVTGFDFSEEKIQDIIHSIQETNPKEFINKIEEFAENQLTPQQKFVLRALKILSSNLFKIILYVFIILTILGIALLHFSFYKWIFNISIALIGSGALTAFFSKWLENVLNSLFKITTISTSNMFQLSIKFLVVGIILFVIYSIFYFIFHKKKEKDE